MSINEVSKGQEKIIPENTEKSTQWAVKVFKDWLIARKEGFPDDILMGDQGKAICECLCQIFLEVHKSDGNHYCPRSLAALLAGLQRHMQ